jgi:hypothetical protein
LETNNKNKAKPSTNNSKPSHPSHTKNSNLSKILLESRDLIKKQKMKKSKKNNTKSKLNKGTKILNKSDLFKRKK